MSEPHLPMSGGSRQIAPPLAARQRTAVRSVMFAVGLGALATLLQTYDSMNGIGSYWGVFGCAAMTAWWVVIAIFLSGRQRQ